MCTGVSIHWRHFVGAHAAGALLSQGAFSYINIASLFGWGWILKVSLGACASRRRYEVVGYY